MKKTALILFTLICSASILCQNMQVTFLGSGESMFIDSVTATNKSKNKSITFPGNEILTLESTTSISSPGYSAHKLRVFPNPFQSIATVSINQSESENVQLNIIDLSGKLVYQTSKFLESGDNSFEVSLSNAGIYFISVISETDQRVVKVVCKRSNNGKSSISNPGEGQQNNLIYKTSGKKSIQSGNFLQYSGGDIVSFTCSSGKHTTTFSDSPKNSRNYKVDFIDCTDKDKRTYKTVKIGDQMWMAENLALMDHPLSSLTEYGIWIYGYEGTNVQSAKSSDSYRSYGCLYDWETATADTHVNGKDICPLGWHLPSDQEWQELQIHLGGSLDEAQKFFWAESGKVGTKLKSKNGWAENGNGNNHQSFNSLPGGYRYLNGDYSCLGYLCTFWSSSEYGNSQAFYRILSNVSDGVYREVCNKDIAFSVRCIKDN